MRIHKIKLASETYQEIKLPVGAGPLSIAKDRDGVSLYYLSENSIVGLESNTFGVFAIPTGGVLPDDVNLFGKEHPLTNSFEPPNAHFLSSVENKHYMVGNPRQAEDEKPKLHLAK